MTTLTATPDDWPTRVSAFLARIENDAQVLRDRTLMRDSRREPRIHT